MRNSLEVRTPSARAQTITRRTYSRPMEGGGFETWDDIVGRVIGHQRWLWQRALGDRPLEAKQENELEELREVLLVRSGSVSGRTLWLGGTEVAKRREASMFNCAFTKIETTHDVVDAFWLLLQGCFAPGTVVKMGDGSYKAIQDIVPGDKVASFDEVTGQFRPSVVSKLNANPPKPLVKIAFEDGVTVVCTEDHLFMTDEGWVAAKDLINKEVVCDAERKPRNTEVAGA